MKHTENRFTEFEAKMRGCGLGEAAVRAFEFNYQALLSGGTGVIRESEIQPVTNVPRLEEVTVKAPPGTELLRQTAVVKLNGGLGTGMGLEKAKSLLIARDGLTFLEFIVRHILYLEDQHRTRIRLLLMNSFSTSRDTLTFLARFPELGSPDAMELLQSQVPKVDAGTLRPATWPANPQLEWCPPGHGDFYPSLLGAGYVDRWLEEGVKYLFVSNSDNLGASLDLGLLGYFAASGKPFLMEVAERTGADRKGGHLASRSGRFILRESAQCATQDLTTFQDIQQHRFFNTNNLWIRLDALKLKLQHHGGFIPLPLIKNSKTVDPRDQGSPRVFQLETAMGAAIGSFEGAGAVVVPRTRFAPVKTTADLLALRSDAYQVTEDWRVVLANATVPLPPTITLDDACFRLVDQLDERLSAGVPSLKHCLELTVEGSVAFDARNVLRGKVALVNPSTATKALPPGEYRDCRLVL
jgi:UDP-N-acetylglucosamine pyrophosphorylase